MDNRPTKTKLRLGIVRLKHAPLGKGVTGEELHALLAPGEVVAAPEQKPAGARKTRGGKPRLTDGEE